MMFHFYSTMETFGKGESDFSIATDFFIKYFEQYPSNLVIGALREHLASSKRLPTIRDVIERIGLEPSEEGISNEVRNRRVLCRMLGVKKFEEMYGAQR